MSSGTDHRPSQTLNTCCLGAPGVRTGLPEKEPSAAHSSRQNQSRTPERPRHTPVRCQHTHIGAPSHTSSPVSRTSEGQGDSAPAAGGSWEPICTQVRKADAKALSRFNSALENVASVEPPFRQVLIPRLLVPGKPNLLWHLHPQGRTLPTVLGSY